MSSVIDRSRRALLFGRTAARASPLRPPWARAEAEFLAACSRCDACLPACPERVLVKGEGGFPTLDFSQGECTFCQACVQACPEPAFRDPAVSPAWDYVAVVSDKCFGYEGVYCRSCGEACEAGAIRFALTERRVPLPTVEAERCTGCGACVGGCPTQAIRVTAP